MNRKNSAQKWFIEVALSYLGTPYLWGGDDPSGFDCSGFVIECLKSVGLINNKIDMTADSLMNFFSDNTTAKPEVGHLIFTLSENSNATHVSICLDLFHQIGAIGGDRRIKNEIIAWEKNAFIKIRPIVSSINKRKFCDPFMNIKD